MYETTFTHTVREHTVTVKAWADDDSADSAVDFTIHHDELTEDELDELLEYDGVAEAIHRKAVRRVDQTAGR